MRIMVPRALLVSVLAFALGCSGAAPANSRNDTTPATGVAPSADQQVRGDGPTSRIEIVAPGELVLIQQIAVNASLERTWNAYTTTTGWLGWVAEVADVDLRPGGLIRTHYKADASLGDPGTNELTIVNFVPQALLTLKVRNSESFPLFMRADAENLINVIVFERISDGKTRVRSYGLGYRDTPEYREVLDFFVGANEKTLLKLRAYLEDH